MTKVNEKLIIGAIAGDIIGSVFEFRNIKKTEFDLFSLDSRFSDDSVLTIATMDTILNNKDYAENYHSFGNQYPRAGYGPLFATWILSNNPKPYNSWGNGSAMRVSPVGWYCNSIEETMAEAKKSAEVTHNHPEGIKGAQAVAATVFMARTGKNKKEIKKFISDTFNYDLDRKLDDIRPNYTFDVSCQGSVPEAIIAFLESFSYENAIRLAISLGGDSDTIACITGGIAEAFYQNIPEYITENVLDILPEKLIKIIRDFSEKYKEEIIPWKFESLDELYTQTAVVEHEYSLFYEGKGYFIMAYRRKGKQIFSFATDPHNESAVEYNSFDELLDTFEKDGKKLREFILDMEIDQEW